MGCKYSMEWYSRREIGTAIWHQARHREVKWLIDDEKVGVFGIRKCRINHSEDTLKWLNILDADKRPTSVYIGTNHINWDAVELPPRLREQSSSDWNKEEREKYAELWRTYLDPNIIGIETYHNIWQGKDMVWDIDDQDLGVAWENSYKIFNYLVNLGYSPEIVFSGNKGFHVWLFAEEAEKLCGFNLKTVEQWDPLRNLGKEYRFQIQKIAILATKMPLYRYDLAPAHRQGIIRCPYSLNGKTGLPVWPLTEEDIKKLNENDFSSPYEVATILFSWETERWDGKIIPTSSMQEVWSRHTHLFE